MFNYNEGETSHYDDFDPAAPTEESLRELETLKQEVEVSVNIHTTGKLGAWYWQHGACAAGRFWFRLWTICLGIHDGAHQHYRHKQEDRDPTSMIHAMGKHSEPDEHADDEVVYYYG